MDAHGLPVRVIITEGTCADIRQACSLVEGIRAEAVIADKAYSVNSFREYLKEEKIEAVIPPIQRGNHSQITYDKHLYKIRHLIENTFLKLKQWRAIASRYAKRASSFLAIVQIRCIAFWCNIL